jgi:putative inorganic carbon (hco3(-)) transporter
MPAQAGMTKSVAFPHLEFEPLRDARARAQALSNLVYSDGFRRGHHLKLSFVRALSGGFPLPNAKVALPAATAALNGASRLDMAGALLASMGAAILLLSASPAVSLAALALLGAAAALRPALGLAVLSLSLPFYLFPKGFGSMAFSMPELILAATATGAAVHGGWIWKTRGRPSTASLATPFDGPIALFLSAALLSLLASEVLRVSLRELRLVVLEPLLAFYLAAWFLRRRGDLILVLAALLLGGVVAAGMGLYQFLFTEHVVAVEGVRRILGPYLSPNHLGLYLGRILPYTLALALVVPSLRIVGIAATLLLGSALVLTFSLGTWLAVLASSLAVILLLQRRLAPALGGLVVLAVAILALVGPERITSHFSLSHGTSFIRLQLWQSSLHMLRDHPLLGVGLDNFLYHYRSGYMLPGAAAEPNLSHPHNIVLGFWLQMGLLGTIAAGWVAVTLLRLWRRLWDGQSALLERILLAGTSGAMVGTLVHGLVDQSYFLVDLAFFFWIAAGMLVALRKRRALSPAGQIE